MQLDEALARIREAGTCFVIFDRDTGEVLEVQPDAPDPAPATVLTTMADASQRHGAVTGRFLDGATITRELLEDEVAEARMVAGRVERFSRWAVLPPAPLIHVLESDDFAEPMDPLHGPRFVIERLFDHAPDVLRPHVPRLERFVRTAQQRFEAPVARLLESKLAVLAGDHARLTEIWERAHPGIFRDTLWHPELLAALGDLRTREPEAIAQLIQTVATGGMFGPRYTAMCALGKIGAPAGPRAVEAIRAAIYDSSPDIAAMRALVIARIETPEDAWRGCPRCYWGRVPGRPWQAPEACETCAGLGVVRT